MPGHARAALAAYPHLGNRPERRLPVWTELGVCEDVLGVHDEALEFCRTVLADGIDVFPLPVRPHRRRRVPDRASGRRARPLAAAPRELGLAAPKAQLHGWFLRQMQERLTDHGRRAICWDEAERTGCPPT